MGVTVDATSSTHTGASTTSLSWSHTCSGSNRYLLVSIGTNGGGSDATGVTYAGVAMTPLGVQQETQSGYRASLWGLIAPASGTNSITVSFNESHAVECCGISFTNADQTTPVSVVTLQQTQSAQSIAQVVANSLSCLVVDSVVWNHNSFPAAESAGPQQTYRVGGAGAFTRNVISTESGSASITMSHGFNASTNAALAVVSVRVTAPPPVGSSGSATTPPAFGTTTTTANNTPGTAMTVTRMSTFNVGDCFIAVLQWATATETINSVPAGWTLIRATTQGTANDISCSSYFKIASAGEAASYTWNMTGTGVQNSVMLVRVTGAHDTTPIDASSGQGGTGAGVSAPALTTNFNNDLLIFVNALKSSQSGITFTPPSGYTTAYILLGAGVCEARGATNTQAGAGSTGAPSGVLSGALGTDPWCSQLIAVRPPVASVDARQEGTVQMPLPYSLLTPNKWPMVYCAWLSRDLPAAGNLFVPPTTWTGLPEAWHKRFARVRTRVQHFQQNPLSAPAPGSPPPAPPPGPPPPPPGPPPTPTPGGGSTNTINARISLPPQQLGDDAQWKRQAAAWMAEANKGHLQNTGVVTLSANQNTTTVIDDRAGPVSMIEFMPRTANAAAELGNGTFFVAAQDNGSFTITHANNANTDRTYVYAILG